jgi:hypothetical protein
MQGESDGGLTLVTPMYAFYTRLLQVRMAITWNFHVLHKMKPEALKHIAQLVSAQ